MQQRYHARMNQQELNDLSMVVNNHRCWRDLELRNRKKKNPARISLKKIRVKKSIIIRSFNPELTIRIAWGLGNGPSTIPAERVRSARARQAAKNVERAR